MKTASKVKPVAKEKLRPSSPLPLRYRGIIQEIQLLWKSHLGLYASLVTLSDVRTVRAMALSIDGMGEVVLKVDFLLACLREDGLLRS